MLPKMTWQEMLLDKGQALYYEYREPDPPLPPDFYKSKPWIITEINQHIRVITDSLEIFTKQEILSQQQKDLARYKNRYAQAVRNHVYRNEIARAAWYCKFISYSIDVITSEL